MKKLVWLILILIGWSSCTQDEDYYGIRPVDSQQNTPNSIGNQVFVINEGNFTWGNASVSWINTDSQTISQQVFYTANNELLGDVAQSMYISGDTGWITVNNSGKIEMVKLPEFTRLKQITGLVSPRYMDCNGTNCYVTDIYGNKLYELDQLTGELIRTIPLTGWSEEVKVVDDNLFISYLDSVVTSSTTKLIRVNRQNGNVTDTIWNKAEALSFTDQFAFGIQAGTLLKYNLTTGEETQLYGDIQDEAIELAIAEVEEVAYYVSNGSLWKYAWQSDIAPSIIYNTSDLNVYNLEVNPTGEAVFLVDVTDFTSKGRVLEISPSGQLIHKYSSGIIPNDLAFWQR